METTKKPIVILSTDFTPENGEKALSTMTTKEKANNAFSHLSQNNLAAYNKFIDKSLKITLAGQTIDRKAKEASSTLSYNMKRSYFNYGSYYIFHVISNPEEMCKMIEVDAQIEDILHWVGLYLSNSIRRKQEFKIFKVHQLLSRCFRPLANLQRIQVLGSSSIDKVTAMLERIKELGTLYNCIRDAASKEEKIEAEKEFRKFFQNEFPS
jgi:hypothetical protein